MPRDDDDARRKPSWSTVSRLAHLFPPPPPKFLGDFRADARLLVFADACAALAAHFPCPAGCGHQLGVELPAYVTSKAEATAGQCLIANGGATPTCAAKHHATQRLCVCVS